MTALLVAGDIIAVGSQALAVREVWRANQLREPRWPADRSFTLFLLRRRVSPDEFRGAGYEHWRRAGWLAAGGWFLGGVLVVFNLPG